MFKLTTLFAILSTLFLSASPPTIFDGTDRSFSNRATDHMWQQASDEIVEVDENADPITIGGRVFGPEDGLKLYTVSVPLNHNNRSINTPMGWAPYYNFYINWGSSWARNQEYTYALHYRGTTQAGGNIYRGERIIRTKITFKRDGKSLGTAQSNARLNGTSWSAGPVAAREVFESLNPRASDTHFYYQYYTIHKDMY